MQEPDAYAFRAFISYTSAPADRQWAEWLHESLETYEVPGSLIAEGMPRKVGRVFLDRREMAATSDLPQALRDALWQSSWLIVICSPRTPQAPWVFQEVECFAAWERHPRMLALLIEGDPRLSFPQGLIQQRRTGTGRDIIIERIEPRAPSVLPRQEKTETELKEEALLALIAPLIGIDFARLEERHVKRLQHATTVLYFQNMTRCRGIPHGIGPLQSLQVAGRAAAFRFELRDGQLFSAKRVNRSEKLLPDDSGCAQWDVTYRSDGTLEAVDVRNRHGQTITRETYSRDGRTVDFQFADDTAKAQSSFAGGIGLDPSVQEKLTGARAEILRHRLTYDENGFEIRRLYFRNSYNVPAQDALGNFGEAHVRDRQGQAVRTEYLDAAGKPAIQRNGVAATACDFDASGNLTRMMFLDAAGQPLLCDRGYAIVRLAHDENGNIVHWQMFDEDDRPCIDKEGVHKVVQTMDEHGHLVRQQNFDTDGQLSRSRTGRSQVLLTRDEDGHEVESRFLDIDGSPVPGPEGFHRCVSAYDDRGSVAEVRYFDAHGAPIPAASGAAMIRYLYDARGNLLETSYFNATGEPAPCNDGYAKLVQRFDERGNGIEFSCFDAKGVPTNHRLGATRIARQYDPRGNMVEESYWNGAGLPALRPDGCSTLVRRYNEQGLSVEQLMLGPDGKLSESTHPARYTWRYDERGNNVETCFFGSDGALEPDNRGAAVIQTSYSSRGLAECYTFLDARRQPVPSHMGCAIVRFRHDDLGRLTWISQFDAQDRPCRNSENYSIRQCILDERGNEIESRYFDEGGLPVLHRRGYAVIHKRFDRYGKVIEEGYGGLQDEPVACEGVARVHSAYDNRGNRISQAFFGIDGSPASTEDGYASRKNVFDQYNRIAAVELFGPDGSPVLSKSRGCWRETYRYDWRGNTVAVASFGLSGEPARCSDGYAIEIGEYDGLDRMTGTAVLDVDGRRTMSAMGFSRIRYKLDDRGRRFFATCHGIDDEPVDRRGGYHSAERVFDAYGAVSETRYLSREGVRIYPPESDAWKADGENG